MINLIQYDDIKIKIDKTKTWINKKHSILYSREIKRRKYYTFKQRWSNINGYDYFLIISDEKLPNSSYSNIRVDDYGRVKIRCNIIIDKINISNDCNITLKLLETDEITDVYAIEV